MSTSLRGLLEFRHREFAWFMLARGALCATPACALPVPPPSLLNNIPSPSSSSPHSPSHNHNHNYNYNHNHPLRPPLPPLHSLPSFPSLSSTLRPDPTSSDPVLSPRHVNTPTSQAITSCRKRPRTSDVTVSPPNKLRRMPLMIAPPENTDPLAIINATNSAASPLATNISVPNSRPPTHSQAPLAMDVRGQHFGTTPRFTSSSSSGCALFPSARSGSGELEMADENTTPSFDCALCPSRFLRKHHLERHIQSIHEGQRPWTCDQCGFSFHQKPNLERHIMTVHEEQKPFRCTICNMSFGRKGVLKKHIQMVHEHSRKFECDICTLPFGLKSDLKRHVQSVHQKKRPFVCGVCSASFGRRSDLKRHTLSLHPGVQLPSHRSGSHGGSNVDEGVGMVSGDRS